jgi:hypothetical protein
MRLGERGIDIDTIVECADQRAKASAAGSTAIPLLVRRSRHTGVPYSDAVRSGPGTGAHVADSTIADRHLQVKRSNDLEQQFDLRNRMSVLES